MNRKHVWVVSILMICFAASVGLAQQKVPPPPKPPDEGPSLADTMQFIQEKMSGIGPVIYAEYVHENESGYEFTNQFKEEISKVQANPATCIVSYHLKWEFNGTVKVDSDHQIALKAVENIMVMSWEQEFGDIDAATGPPLFSTRVDPPVFVLRAVRSKNAGFDRFSFLNEDMANRVAKAMVHAVELCGGGNKDPF